MKEEYRFNLWFEGLKIFGGLLYCVLSYSLIVYLGLGFWGLYFYLLFTGLLFSAVHWFKGFTVLSFVKNAIGLFVFLLLMRWLNSSLGFTGYVLGFLLLIGVLLYSRRKQYLKVKYHIESLLFGKPIKEFVKNKEPLPKLKLKF
jgi:hypothetical protein